MNESKLTNKQVVKYNVYGLTSFMAMMPAFMYYRTFMQVNLHVSAELMAVLVLIGTGVDFVLSLAAGPIVEKNNGGKHGKFRYWFKIFPFVMVAGTIVCFIAPAGIQSGLIKGLICILGYILICGAVTFLGNANFGILAAMAGPSLTDRNRISIMGARMMAVATIVTSLTILPVKTAITNATGNEQLGYLIVSAFFGLTILIGAKCTLDVSKDYDLPRTGAAEGAAEGPSIGQMFASVAKNKQLLCLILIYTIYNFGFNFAAGFEMYFFMFFKLTPATFTVPMTIHQTARSCAGLLGALIGPKLGMKLGKKKAIGTGLALWGAGLLGAYFCIASLPWFAYTAFSCINSLAMNVFSGFGVNYFLDCGEYGYYTTGEDNRTIAMSMFNIPIKLATMVAGTMSGLALGWINFDSVSIGGGAMTPEIEKGFLFWFTLFPAICMGIAALLAFLGYKISDKDAAFYAAENAKKDAALRAGAQG